MKGFILAIAISLTSLTGILIVTSATTVEPRYYPTASSSEPTYHLSKQVVSHLRLPYASSVSILRGDKSIASGVVLRHDRGKQMLVVTNFHVVKQLKDWNNVYISKGKKFKRHMIVSKTDKVRDLALLVSRYNEMEDGPEAVISTTKPLLGEQVWVIGNPIGHQRNITTGAISLYIKLKRNGKLYYRTDAAIFFGNSGGGVYNSSGNLVGIAVGAQMLPSKFGPPIPIPGGGLVISRQELMNFIVKDL